MKVRWTEPALRRLRELIEGSYRIVYRVQGDRVEILTVFEAHRLLLVGDIDGQSLRGS